MTPSGVDYDELFEIVKFIEASKDVTVFRLRRGDMEVEIRKGEQSEPIVRRGLSPPTASTSADVETDQPALQRREPLTADLANLEDGTFLVRSPMVGVFYRAPSPGAPPFVEIGQRVEAATTVCIIEVMKLMNSIPAGRPGTVERVLVENAQLVEFDQPLIIMRAPVDAD